MHQRGNDILSNDNTLAPLEFSDISEALRNIGETEIVRLATLRSRLHYRADLSDVSPEHAQPCTLAHFLRGAVDESVHLPARSRRAKQRSRRVPSPPPHSQPPPPRAAPRRATPPPP